MQRVREIDKPDAGYGRNHVTTLDTDNRNKHGRLCFFYHDPNVEHIQLQNADSCWRQQQQQ